MFWRLVYLDERSHEHYFLIGMMSLSSSIASIVAGMFYSIMLGVFYLLRLLNDEVEKVMTAIAGLGTTESAFYVQRQFCELSDRLDALAEVHLQVTRVAQQISNMVTINILLWIMFKAGTILLMCLTSYMYCMGWAFFEDFKMPIQIFLSDIASMCLTLTETYMFVHMCAQTIHEVQFFIDSLILLTKNTYFPSRPKKDFKYYIYEVSPSKRISDFSRA